MGASQRQFTAAQLVKLPPEKAWAEIRQLPPDQQTRLMGEIGDLDFEQYATIGSHRLTENLNRNVMAEAT